MIFAAFVGVLLFVLAQVQSQSQESPCPDRFRYLPKSSFFSWSGELLVTSDVDLIDGVFIVLIFDKPIKKLGSTFGKQIVKRNETEYLLRNFGFQLEKNKLFTIRIDVEFDSWSDPPNFVGYRLNAITWCPKKAPQSGFQTGFNSPPNFSYQYLNNQPTTAFDVSSNNQFSSNQFGYNSNKGMAGFFGSQPSNTESFSQCGVPKSGSVTNNGHSVNLGEFPWHATIFLQDPPKIHLICGGTLISSKYILTSASCLTGMDKEKLVVNLGGNQIFDLSSTTQRLKVQSIIFHPQFTPDVRLKNDLAIIVLAQPAIISDTVKPACLWSRFNEISGNEIGVVPGFGLIDPQKTASELRKTYLPLLTKEKCPRSEKDMTFCAGFPNETFPCQLDPGSGLVVKKQLDPTRSVFEIRGIVTSGLPEYGNCDLTNKAIFTDVAKHIGWIINSINPQ